MTQEKTQKNKIDQNEVIALLEKMAADASLQNDNAINILVEQSSLTDNSKKALLNSDIITLERNLDVCPDIVCLISSPEDDEPEQEEDAPEKTEVYSMSKLVVNG
ncbi:MAG: hypothetical protein OCD00_15330 [Colwellia sp.]